MSFPVNLDTALGARAAGATAKGANATREEAAARQVAQQFESLLLRQLTASLVPSADEEGEDSLFGGGGGMGLSRQLFSEQLADTMAQAGGVGLADVLMGQLGGAKGAPNPAKNTPALKAADAVRLVRESAPSPDASVSVDKSDVYLISEAADGPNPESLPATEAPHVRPRRVFPLTPDGNAVSANSGLEAARERRPLSPTAAEPVELHMYVKGAVRSNFGVRKDPFTGKRKFHSGVDIPAPRGTPIGAAAAGRVVFAGRQRGYGNTVILEHADGTRTRYAHAEQLYVRKGDYVGSGDSVGAVGSTGRSTGPHLHFEVMRNGRHLNPLKELAKDLTPHGR